MSTTFDTWLQTLAASNRGGASVSLPIATRGLKWDIDFEYDGSWATATLEGSISASPDGTALAAITVGAAVYNADDDTTTWPVSLAAGSGSNSTGVLPSDTDGDGVEFLPIAFYITPSGGSKELVFGAAFPLTGKV